MEGVIGQSIYKEETETSERKRETGWEKRLIAFSLFISLIYSHMKMGAKQYFVTVIKTR